MAVMASWFRADNHDSSQYRRESANYFPRPSFLPPFLIASVSYRSAPILPLCLRKCCEFPERVRAESGRQRYVDAFQNDSSGKLSSVTFLPRIAGLILSVQYNQFCAIADTICAIQDKNACSPKITNVVSYT